MYRILAAIGCLWASCACAQDAPPPWGYAGAEGPEHWAGLSPQYAACNGERQSPIDIAAPQEVDLPPIEFAYAPVEATLLHTGHAVQADLAAGNAISVDGRRYALRQFHFHVPSENRIAGVSYPLEAHYVHADADGRLAVIAVLYKVGASNAALGALWPQLPKAAGARSTLPAPLAVDTLLPASRDYYAYDGSLTTPPCTEGVRWLVMKDVQTASNGQISRLLVLLPHANSRPVQPLHGREVQQ